MADARPTVDVGVVTWNTRELSVRALRNLLDTEQGVDIRLFVRDNASADGTADAIAAEVPEAVLDRGADNLGFGTAMNLLIRASDAPWFFALNSDAWPEPGAIGLLVETALSNDRYAAVAPRLERPDGTLEHSTHRFPSPRLAWRSASPRYVQQRPAAARELLLHDAWDHDEPCDVDWAVGAALLMRRSALDAIGGFDERLFMYAEDLEWCWRAHDRGWRIRFEPRSVVRHVGNASGEQNYSLQRSAAYWRNTYRVVRWRRGGGAALCYRAANLAGATRAVARHRRDPDLRAHFRRELAAHSQSRRGPDKPPS